MNKNTSQKILDNSKLLNHFMEQSYWIKVLNRNPNFFSQFQKEMKKIYKERPSDKINSAIDGVEMLSTIIDASK